MWWTFLDGGDVLRLHPLPALGRLVGDLGALFEGLEPVARYAAVVHEEILTPIIRGDEPVPLVVVEPLNRSLGHVLEPLFLVPGLYQIKSRLFFGRRSICYKPTFDYQV